MKKILLLVLSTAFAFSFISNDQQQKKEQKPILKKLPDHPAKVMRSHRRW